MQSEKQTLRHGGVKHSFTLIELLVVIAIIAILAAILLPSLQKARHRGMSAQCQSNLKQLGVTFFQYANSYGDWFPCGHGGSGFWWAIRSWYPNFGIESSGTPGVSSKIPGTKVDGGREQQMLRAPLFYCPQRTRNVRSTKRYNEIYYVTPSWTSHFGGVPKLTKVFSPAKKFMLMEHHYDGDGGAVALPRYSNNAFVHGKRGNILHFDGHVEGYQAVPPYFKIQSSGNQKQFHYHWKPTCRTPISWNGKDCKEAPCNK